MSYPKLFIAAIVISLINSVARSQPIAPPNKDFIIVDHEVWDLKSDGTIEIFNTNGGYNKKMIASLMHENVNSIAKDSHGNIYASLNKGRLLRLRKNDTVWKDITPDKFDSQYDFVVNANGEVFQVTHDGIIDAQNGKTYVPGKEFCFSEYRVRGGLFGAWDDNDRPSLTLDHRDRLWLVVSYGEWGGDAFCFNTDDHSFFKITGDIAAMVGGFCDAKDKVFAIGDGSKGGSFTRFGFLSYFSDFSPATKNQLFHQSFYTTYNNPGHDKLIQEQKSLYPKDYIGTTAYNPVDKMIYFYCEFGLYKGDLQKSLSDITKWSKVSEFKLQPQNMKPRIHQYVDSPGSKDRSGFDLQEDYDVNMPYDLWKMSFSDDGKLVFVTYHDGLGIFDGKKITILDPGSSL